MVYLRLTSQYCPERPYVALGLKEVALTFPLFLLHALPAAVDGGDLRLEGEVVVPDVLQLLLQEGDALQAVHLLQVRCENERRTHSVVSDDAADSRLIQNGSGEELCSKRAAGKVKSCRFASIRTRLSPQTGTSLKLSE